MDGLVDEARRRGMGPGPGEPMAIDAVLPDGTRVVGSVRLRLDPASPGPVRLYYSRAKASHRVAAWLDLMALLATDPATPWRSVAVSRPESGKSALMVTDLVASADITGGSQTAGEVLAVAVDCFRRGMTEPIPLFPTFSYQLYRAKNAEGSWRSYPMPGQKRIVPGDGDRPAVRLAFGDIDYETLMQMEPRSSDPPGPKGRGLAVRHLPPPHHRQVHHTRPGATDRRWASAPSGTRR